MPLCALAALASAAPAPLGAQADEATAFAGYVQLLAARARAEGVSEPTITAMTTGLAPNQRVLVLDRNQPGATPGAAPAFRRYYQTHVDAPRIGNGRAKLREVAPLLPGIEARFGVPAPILLAIWGHETSYGKVKGTFDLSQALATLAFEGRRRELFTDEFVALLKIADQGVPRARLVGSWAGAFGNPQFLPSVYLRLGRDGDGDGKADIWNNEADTLASIAAYFRDAGWQPGETWGVRAALPAELDRASIASRLAAPSCPTVFQRHSQWKTVAEWRALGVSPLGAIADTTLATLIEPDGPGTEAFLLTGNYRVILQYNCSNYYALSVGLLADEIAR